MEEENKLNEEIAGTEDGVTESGTGQEALSEPDTRFGRWKKRRAEKKEAKRKKEEAKGFWQNFFETILYFAVVILIALSIKKWVGQPVIVSGDSMNDTLNNYNFVWTNKINYTPKRFDVVTVKSAKTDNNMYIKRVIALPGETVYIDKNDKIHIIPEGGTKEDGYILEDPYGYFSDKTASQGIEVNALAGKGKFTYIEGCLSYTCGENEYFLMGDNRHNSKDSRYLGGFKRSEIVGHAVVRIWPLNKLGNFDKSNEK